MPTIQIIKKIEDAKPQKGVWFDYYGEIFVSVVPTNYKHHIRRKAKIEDGKKDNKMSAWHLEWQYDKIENTHGQSVGKERTFEIAIDVNGERHIIDSVVGKLAIEFQHSLGVSIEEMDSRFLAHKKAGFVPYLVLDLTEYPLNDYYLNSSKLLKNIFRWKSSEYFKAGNLFVDLEDWMLRISMGVKHNHLQVPKKHFLLNLFELEKEYQSAIIYDIEGKEKQLQALEIEWQAKHEWRDQAKRGENRKAKFESVDYEYFRQCYRNPIIRPHVFDNAKDLFEYHYEEIEGEDSLEKMYFFKSMDQYFMIRYSNIFKKEWNEVGKIGKLFLKNVFQYSEVRVYGEKLGYSFSIGFKIEAGKTEILD